MTLHPSVEEILLLPGVGSVGSTHQVVFQKEQWANNAGAKHATHVLQDVHVQCVMEDFYKAYLKCYYKKWAIVLFQCALISIMHICTSASSQNGTYWISMWADLTFPKLQSCLSTSRQPLDFSWRSDSAETGVNGSLLCADVPQLLMMTGV